MIGLITKDKVKQEFLEKTCCINRVVACCDKNQLVLSSENRGKVCEKKCLVFSFEPDDMTQEAIKNFINDELRGLIVSSVVLQCKRSRYSAE